MGTRKIGRAAALLGVLVGLLVGTGGLAGAAAIRPDDPAANAGWEEMGVGSASGGGISNNSATGWSNWNALAIGPDGTPYVAWYHWSNGAMEIFVRRWDGAAWVEVGAGSASGGGISNNSTPSNLPSIAVAPDGSPIVAWQEETNGLDNSEIFVRRWDGAAWVGLGGSASGGGISNTSSPSTYPAIAVAADGRPIVAWSEAISEDVMEIYVRRWDGVAWSELGTNSASGGGISDSNSRWASNPSLVITPGDSPVVAWDGVEQIFALRWNGAAWVEMGGSASAGGVSVAGSSWNNSLAVGPDGNPVVAWQYHGAGAPQKIYLRRWNGAAWVELAGSASGEGIGVGWGLSVAVVAAGNWPIVAWANNSSGDWEIYARRWNGSAWVEHSGGSAGGGGISDNGVDSTTPSLAMAGSWAYVAWDDDSYGNDEIYVRRSAPIAAICYFLNLEHDGQGADPIAVPTNSPGCGAGYYSAGQAISLTAAPGGGWSGIIRWSGTNDDSSTASTNSLTMPAHNHTVRVTYELPPATHTLFTPAIMDQPFICFAGPHEQEPNNTRNEANGPLCNGQSYLGRPDDTYDVFYFDTAAAGSIDIVLNNFAAGGGQLGLLSADFAPIVYDVTPGNGLRISRANEPAGRYYIVVHTPAPDAAAGPYTLQATFP